MSDLRQNSTPEPVVASPAEVGSLRDGGTAAADVAAPGALEHEHARELEAIQSVTDVALAHLALDRLVPELLERVRAVLVADNAAILLVTEDGRDLTMYQVRGPEVEVAGDVRVPIGQGVAGRIAATRQPLIVEDLTTAEAANPFLQKRLRSLVGVPLVVEGRLLGVLHAATVAPRRFTQRDVRLLSLVADRIALALDRARLYEVAEGARREAQALSARLEAVIEAVPGPLSLHDAAGRLVHLNRIGREQVGSHARREAPEDVALADLPGTFGLLTPEGASFPMEEQPVARALRGERVSDVEMRRVLPDGQALDILVSAAPLRDAEGRVDGVVTVSRDITALRRAERALAERAQQMAATFESMADGVVVYDMEGRIVQTNAAARTLFACDAQPEDTSRPLNELVPRVETRDAQGRPVPVEDWPQRRVLRGEVLAGSGATDYLLRVLNGREVMVNVTGAPARDEGGEIAGGVLILRDVTEQRRLERRTREALDALLSMARVLVEPETAGYGARDDGGTGPAGRTVREVARRLAVLTCQVLGCQRVGIQAVEAGTLLVRPLAVVGLAPEQEAQWWAEQEAHPAHYGEGADPAMLAQFEAGEPLVLDMRQPPYRDLPNPYGITTSVFAALRAGQQMVGILSLDYGGEPHAFTPTETALAGAVAQLAALVIERDRLQGEREAAVAGELALRTINQRMDEFLGMAAHDLKSPAASSKLTAQVAGRRAARVAALLGGDESAASAETGELRRALETVERSMDRLARLVDRLLDVSRVRTGSLELCLAPFDVAALVRDCVEEQRALAPGRDIRLEAPEGPAPVVADADRIGQVVTNYLTNALRYSPPEQPIGVVVGVEGGVARVAVTDAGPGIAPEEREGIWARFQRAPGVRQQAGKDTGLGLGLYISREIVERHGGAVGVESAPGPGGGSTFWFTLRIEG